MDHDSKDTETPAPVAPRSDPSISAEPAAATDLWAVSYSEEEDRELTHAEVENAIERGEITAETIVWRPGMDAWVPLSQTPDFAPLFAQGAPAAEEPRIPEVEALAPSAEEPPPAAAVEKSPAAIAEAPAPVPSVPPPSARSVPSAPPSAPSVPSVPSAAPSVPSAPSAQDLDQRFTPSRTRYAIAGGAVVAALLAVFWWVESSSREPVPERLAQVATQRASASLPPTPSLLPHQTPAGNVSPDDETDGPRPPLQPFNRIAALKVMGKAAEKAIRCRGRGAPAGVARLTVTFEPSGKMSAARIFQAPYAGTPTATCIVAKIGRPEVPPFKGPPETIRVSVELY
jgi:hypothetical protein